MGRYLGETSSFRPSSRSADFVSSSFCFETPPSGDTSTFNVSLKLLAEANLERTFGKGVKMKKITWGSVRIGILDVNVVFAGNKKAATGEASGL